MLESFSHVSSSTKLSGNHGHVFFSCLHLSHADLKPVLPKVKVIKCVGITRPSSRFHMNEMDESSASNTPLTHTCT